MKVIERFLRELDSIYAPEGPGRQPLHVLGSAALMLQVPFGYPRELNPGFDPALVVEV